MNLQTMCANMGIYTQVQVDQVLQGGVDKPNKVTLQILIERGWIHPDKIHMYTERGKTISSIASGNLEPSQESSICELMKLQSDFVNEITFLQHYGTMLGIVVDHIPKYHPEIAGKGIEYAWDIAKLHYRRLSLEKKRAKAGFKNLAMNSLDTVNVLTLKCMRLCSRKARNYMKMYIAIEDVDSSGTELTNKHVILEDSMKFYKNWRR